VKNRESAARSRNRKQQYTDDLEIEVQKLTQENEALRKLAQARAPAAVVTPQVCPLMYPSAEEQRACG
jgi:hypothetical protein